ncbi:hypothetical protein LKO27_13375 [Tessaracoccus sp. OS52]|uniref:hypothetical protein n=1 Tax=Tessaracoccus sp. OS52 TaxID=2886691 RepID=UPI001D12C071|nr:hypothetical protein [Tessaracoccus sp. OS52]MCC2594395.1 hypothetical protein [Tessaracoccus sp. OS52]
MGKKRRKAMRFHMPFTATAPPLTSKAVGLTRLVELRGRSNSSDVTIIDAPDNRLLRAGVVVAHRVSDGLGEWTLEAPRWAPRLPQYRSEPIGASAELPLEFAVLIRPIARGATLGPVAALSVRHSEYTLCGEDDASLGSIVDELVTVRRGGVATARYRETSVFPSDDMTPQQREFVLSSMLSVSATPVGEFPTLQQRLGPPATGLTDFPEPQPVRRESTMEDLVTAVFARDLQDLVDVLLDLELGRPDDVGIVGAQLDVVARDVRGFAHALDPQWRESVERVLAGVRKDSRSDVVAAALQVAEALVGAVHAPRLGDVSHDVAAPLLYRRAQQGIYILADRCRSLEANSPNPQWAGALQAAEQLAVSASVVSVMPSKVLAKSMRLLEELSGHLRACVAEPEDAKLDGLTVAEAYELGARRERERLAVARSRAEFVAVWPERVAKLRKYMEKAKSKG